MGDRAIKHYVWRARLRQSRQRRVAAARSMVRALETAVHNRDW
jgi:hypothetical protein